MNHLAASDDYGLREKVGSARQNLSWLLVHRQHIPLEKTDYQNIDRCVQHKFWSAKMCEWLDTLRSKYDANYLAEKVKKQQKAISYLLSFIEPSTFFGLYYKRLVNYKY